MRLCRLFSRHEPVPVPTYAIYCDRSKRGKYSARIVDEESYGKTILPGKPNSIFMLNVSTRYQTPSEAILDIAERLERIGVTDAAYATCYYEHESYGVKTMGNPLPRGEDE